MSVKTESEYMAFRPGDHLREEIEDAAGRNGCTKSDVLRQALEMYLDLDPVRPFECYLGAASSFLALAQVAAAAGLFSEELYVRLVKAVEATERPVKEKWEHLWKEYCPVVLPLEKFYGEREHLTEKERAVADRMERWATACSHFSYFPDLQKARGLLSRHAKTRAEGGGQAK